MRCEFSTPQQSYKLCQQWHDGLSPEWQMLRQNTRPPLQHPCLPCTKASLTGR